MPSVHGNILYENLKADPDISVGMDKIVMMIGSYYPSDNPWCTPAPLATSIGMGMHNPISTVLSLVESAECRIWPGFIET